MTTQPQEGANRPLYSTVPQNTSAPQTTPAPAKSVPVMPPQPWVLAALGSYPLAYLYVRGILFHPLQGNLALPAFAALFVAGVWALARALHRTPARETSLWAVCYLALSAVMALWGDQPGGLGVWQTLVWHLFAIWFVLARCNVLAQGFTGSLVFLDALAGLFRLPWPHFFKRLQTAWAALRAAGHKQVNAARVAAGVGTALLALAVCGVAWGQLSAADANFAALGADFTVWLNDHLFNNVNLVDFVFYGLLSLPVGAWLFGLIHGALARAQAPCTAAAFWRGMAPLQRLPRYTGTTVVAALCGVYALFFGLQIAEFWPALGAAARLTPVDAATFAVEGFWELFRILLLNFAVLAALRFLGRAQPPKALLAVFGGFGVAFAALAGAKLVRYIQLYGFTPRRVVSGWFLCVLAVWAVLALVRVFQPIPAARIALAVLVVSFTLLSCCNIKHWIIQANLYRYEQGIDAELDWNVLYACGYNGSDPAAPLW